MRICNCPASLRTVDDVGVTHAKFIFCDDLWFYQSADLGRIADEVGVPPWRPRACADLRELEMLTRETVLSAPPPA